VARNQYGQTREVSAQERQFNCAMRLQIDAVPTWKTDPAYHWRSNQDAIAIMDDY
jgi:hypothetical protein